MRIPSGFTQSIGLPPVEVAAIHLSVMQCHCPACKELWRNCKCEMTPKLKGMIGDPPHQSRPWGFKGVQTLPDNHPDNPNRK